jgi:hypothetical protein
MLLLALMLSHAGCFLNEKLEPYYGRVVVPRTQEFHWSDGGLPQTFDPAFAAAPPDTDLVRAIFEGLTDYDPQTLTPIPAVATRWEASNGGKVWTFYLRDDARWSNGESVTAGDFVRSWRRTMRIGDLAPHTELLANIEGARHEIVANNGVANSSATPAGKKEETVRRAGNAKLPEPSGRNNSPSFGVEALSDRVLRVRLRRPDMNFPALVAHPVFRPVKLKDESATTKLAPGELISNGAFSLARTESARVLLERAATYWNKDQVTLQQVAFVGEKDPESALAAYRAGEVDAVTNAAFEPLAIKLLTPYEDFRRTTYGALTYYNESRGHLMKFDANGNYAGAYDFGWDVTPAVWPHDGSYSVVVKDNQYFYWNDPTPKYLISQLDNNFIPEWQHQNLEVHQCQRETDGGVTCVDDGQHPNGFEWCINAPAVDRDGTVFVNSEDGNLYAIGQGGVEKGHYFMEMAITAAYTPLALDRHGRVYTMNFGKLSVLGQGSAQPPRSAR